MSVYVKTSKNITEIVGNDLRNLNANNEYKTYKENGWTVRYAEIYKHIHYVHLSKVYQSASSSMTQSLVIAGMPIVPIVDTKLPVLVHVANTPVGYGNATFSGNSGVYLNATGYSAAHEYNIFGYLICK